jgi:hypothetical protein
MVHGTVQHGAGLQHGRGRAGGGLRRCSGELRCDLTDRLVAECRGERASSKLRKGRNVLGRLLLIEVRENGCECLTGANFGVDELKRCHLATCRRPVEHCLAGNGPVHRIERLVAGRNDVAPGGCARAPDGGGVVVVVAGLFCHDDAPVRVCLTVSSVADGCLVPDSGRCREPNAE